MFIRKFEAIESRLVSIACPRGTSGRLHTLRLRRHFNSNGLRAAAAAEKLADDADFYDQADFQLENTVENTTENPHGHDGGFGGIVDQTCETVLSTRGLHWYEDFYSNGRIGSLAMIEAIKDLRAHALPDQYIDTTVGLQEQVDAIYAALRTGSPHFLLGSLTNLLRTERDVAIKVLGDLTPTTFSELLRCLDPRQFIAQHAQLHREISPTMASVLGLSNVLGGDDHYQFCKSFMAKVMDIIDARIESWPLTLLDYKYLLKCAQTIGHVETADRIWASLVRAEQENTSDPNIKLDVECYNLLMATKCWQDVMNPKQRYHLRVIPDYLRGRAKNFPPYNLKGHQIGLEKGIRAQIFNLFCRMVENGVTGTEETFSSMITSMGREGDIIGIASILNRVWGVDVEGLTVKNESDLPPPRRYSANSPLYPSSHLLFAIAHAYGTNNDIPTALKVVDYISRQYSTPITQDVWNELLQWTSVLAFHHRGVVLREGEEIETGREIGRLPVESVSSLWETMTSAPYNVKPSMEMYNRLITNLRDREKFGEMQLRMEEARELYDQDEQSLSKHESEILNIHPNTPKHILEQKASDLFYANLRVSRNKKYFERWARILLQRGGDRLKYNERWIGQEVPNIVKTWSKFLPDEVAYHTRAGHVSFRGQSESKLKHFRYCFVDG